MRKLLLILTLACAPVLFADDVGLDTGPLPNQGRVIGGKGADGLFHFLKLANDGSLSASGTFTASPNTITTAGATNVAVTSTSGTALASNASRKDAVLVNYGATGCFLRRGTPATAGTGIYLAPSGGAYNIDFNNLYTGIITVITASGTTTLTVSEGQ